MIINIGKKHNGKSTELVSLKEPDYVKWVLEKSDATGPLLRIKNDFLRLIEIFDGKSLTSKCFKCKEPATRLSFYKGDTVPFSWCSECDPYNQGAINGKLNIFSNYHNALEFVESYCGGNKSYYKHIIKNIASLKGLPDRVGEKQAQDFFI